MESHSSWCPLGFLFKTPKCAGPETVNEPGPSLVVSGLTSSCLARTLILIWQVRCWQYLYPNLMILTVQVGGRPHQQSGPHPPWRGREQYQRPPATSTGSAYMQLGPGWTRRKTHLKGSYELTVGIFHLGWPQNVRTVYVVAFQKKSRSWTSTRAPWRIWVKFAMKRFAVQALLPLSQVAICGVVGFCARLARGWIPWPI